MLKQSPDSSVPRLNNRCYSEVKSFSINVFLYFSFILMNCNCESYDHICAERLIHAYLMVKSIFLNLGIRKSIFHGFGASISVLEFTKIISNTEKSFLLSTTYSVF